MAVSPRKQARPRDRGLLVAIASVALAVICAGAALAASTDFSEPASSPEAAGMTPVAIAAGDLDGDGDADLAVANLGSDDVTILKNNGVGNFFESASSPEPGGGEPASVAAANFDGDGDVDLVVGNQASDDLTFMRNSGTANFVQPATSPEASGANPVSVAAADFDHDGDADLAITNNVVSGQVTILKNNGLGNFKALASSPEAAGSNPASVAAGDLDGDLDPDLAVANISSGNVTILKNNGNGNFNQPATSPEAVGSSPLSVAAADLDGDLDRDLVVANFNDANVTILKNNGNGNFVQPASSPEFVGLQPSSVAAADFDGDGDRDLAVTNSGAASVTILENAGNGNFTQPASSPEGAASGAYSSAVADFDADTDFDLAITNYGAGNVTILKSR